MLGHLPRWSVRNRIDASPLFGLCAFECHIPADEHTKGARLIVEVNGSKTALAWQAVAAQITGDSSRLQFHLNSHLLPNGMQTIRAMLELPNGSILEWQTQDFEIDNTGDLASRVAVDLKQWGTPLVFGQTVDSTLYPYDGGRAVAWFNEGSDTPAPPLSFEPARDGETARRHMARWGFCVLNTKLPSEMIERFNREIDDAISDGRLAYKLGSSDRIYGAHKLETGHQVWLYPPVLRFLRDWFRDEPCACQSLLYMHGSEQNAHQDTIHLTPYPAGFMCGVWVALEDVKKNSGELFVYPGSHKTPRLMSGQLNLEKVSTDYSSYAAFDRRIRELIEEAGYELATYRPKAGQILVWHENLVHGGSRRSDVETTRRSIVSHYFARGGVAYYDSRGEAASLEAVL